MQECLLPFRLLGLSGSVSWLLAGLAILVALILIARRLPGNPADRDDLGEADRRDSLRIIEARYARGDLSEEEFRRMRDILNR